MEPAIACGPWGQHQGNTIRQKCPEPHFEGPVSREVSTVWVGWRPLDCPASLNPKVEGSNPSRPTRAAFGRRLVEGMRGDAPESELADSYLRIEAQLRRCSVRWDARGPCRGATGL